VLIIYYYISSISSLFPFLFSLNRIKSNSLDKFQKVFISFLIYKFLSDLTRLFTEPYITSYPIFHLTVVLDFIFYTELIKATASFKYIRVFQFIIIAIEIYEIYLNKGVYENNWLTTIVSYSTISFIYYVLLVGKPKVLNNEKFIVLASIFAFHTIMLIYFLFENLIRSNTTIFNFLEPIILSLYILLNFSLSYALWKNQKN
jgi:hypothetical protein